MTNDRREALGWAGAIFGWMAMGSAAAQASPGVGGTGGKEVAPGVREIFLTSQDVRLARYKLLWMTRLTLAAGAATPPDILANDTVVLMEQGLLRVRLDQQEFVLCGPGGLWAFPQEAKLSYHNTGADLAVLLVI